MGKVARPYPSGHLRLYKTKRQKPGTAVPVQMEYVVHSTPVRRSTGVTVKESDWDPKANKGRGGLKASYGPDYRNINNRLIHKLEALDDKIARWCEENPNRMTVETLRAFLDGTPATRPDKGIDFCEFVKGHLKNELDRNRIGQSVYRNGLSAVKVFGEFLKSTSRGTYAPGKIFVSEITTCLRLALTCRTFQTR